MNEKSKFEDTPPKPADTKAPVEKPVAKKPTIKARKPISKAEYARTTEQSADSTSVMPAIKDDAEAAQPAGSESSTSKSAKVGPAGVAQPVTPKAASAKKAASAATSAAVVSKESTKAAQKQAAKVAAKATPATNKKTAKAEARTIDPLDDTAAHQAIDEDVKPTIVDKAVEKTTVMPVAVSTREPEAPSDLARRRKVRRKLTYIEPWTVTKMSFVVSVAMMIVLVVAAVVFWFVMQVTGVWEALNDSVVNVLSDGSSSFDVTDYVGLARITGLTLIVSAFNVVFSTALATIGAHLYNLAASMMGGVEVTFEDRKN